ncbi:MAG: HEAT repeat domain-containing protein [Fuerstiella sp.]|nr:HEAT repeat domain-containing protein [Fuerstiella sp.]MCP4506579.1 HEAT repeat domain-containing protein [Fuerstiella sp.]
MTACYAKDRKEAIHRLGDHFDCCCHPEIMNAFIYALNDSDERVRAKAADEIGDQIRRNRCCCGASTISALTCALADCDRSVRRQAEEALLWSGYEIVDRCCVKQPCRTCAPGTNVWAGHNEGIASATSGAEELVVPALFPPTSPVPPPAPEPAAAPSAPVEVPSDSATSMYDNAPPGSVEGSETALNSEENRLPRSISRLDTETFRTSLTAFLQKIRP